MSHLELLMMLRRYRLLFLAIFVVAFFVGGYFLLPRVLKYKGSATFYLANESMVSPTLFSQGGQRDMLQFTLVQERVYQLAYSTEMMLFLINSFNLYKHYNVDTTQINYFAKTIMKISQSISFNKIGSDLSTIIVYDRNNEIAATMANAIVWKLDQLNKKYLIDKLEANLNFYNSYVNEAALVSKQQNDKLFDYMEEMKEMRQRPDGVKKPLSEIEFSLYTAAAKIEDMTTQLVMAKSLYSSALSAQKSKNLPSLVVIKRALPETSSNKIYLVLFSMLAATLTCVVMILLMYFYFSYRTEILIVFGRNLPAPKT